MNENEFNLDTMIELLTMMKQKKGGSSKKKALTVASVNNATMLAQPGGIFTVAGMERDVFSTHLVPEGIASFLPSYPARIDDPRYGFLTGFTATTGSEPTNPCDDAPKGFVKSGTLTAAWGRVMRETQTIEIDKVLHEARESTSGLRLIGDLLGWTESEIDDADPLDMVVQMEMIGVGVQLERKTSVLNWQGNPANNTSGGGYKEYPGLDRQINTGQVDAESNVAMPAADSLLFDFGHTAVDSTTKDIVEFVSMMEYYLRDKARKQRMEPATWLIVMRPELWHQLSMVWPCRYYTNRCTNAAGTAVVTINDDGVKVRDAMRQGMYLEVNGRRYQVALDDGIFEHSNTTTAGIPAGSYSSSIYFVPLRVRGNFPVTYFEFINYRNIDAQLRALGEGGRKVPFWTNSGRLLWAYVDLGGSFCFKLQAKLEDRIILRTPHLAGKIQGVRYTPMQHLDSPYPDSPYFKDGGVSLRGFTGAGFHVW